VLARLAGFQKPENRERIRANLVAGTRQLCQDKSCVFDNIEPFLSLPPELVHVAHGSEGGKTMIDPKAVFDNLSSPCIVYGLGIATDSTFETAMSTYCEVHAFDCTISPDTTAVLNKRFKFHRICLGPTTDITKSNYGSHNEASSLVFQSLEETMNQLGHKKIDVLKFDIEGSEWSLFDTILQTPPSHLPAQMFFEIHTETANPTLVPASTVKGRRKPDVNNLFVKLLDLGYFVYSKILNDGDPACAEFSLVRLPKLA